MEKDIMIPDPEKKLNIIRRYLHILALLQNPADPADWNGSTLADVLSLDERDHTLSDKAVRDYIRDHLRGELDLPIDMEKGARRIELSGPIERDMLGRLISIYSLFVAEDSSREDVLRGFIRQHPADCLWMLARIYFAGLEKKMISFDYTTNTGHRMTGNLACPYHLVIRNNNLYLVARLRGRTEPWLLVAGRVENLSVTGERFDEEIPPLDSIFSDPLGSFIGDSHRVTLRFAKDLRVPMMQFLGILDPDITECDDGTCTAEFSVTDEWHLCKQIFPYGGKVEIVAPGELRDLMKKMLKESLAVYE